ncbi:MAG: hypothetical protein JRD89_02895 [Deltaproteobacteria bacterium]|nr:hypothetical protein [Deltaproteobacteria bacterium]
MMRIRGIIPYADFNWRPRWWHFGVYLDVSRDMVHLAVGLGPVHMCCGLMRWPQ